MKKSLTPEEFKEKIKRDAANWSSVRKFARIGLGIHPQYVRRALDEDDHIPEPVVKAYRLKKKVIYVDDVE